MKSGSQCSPERLIGAFPLPNSDNVRSNPRDTQKLAYTYTLSCKRGSRLAFIVLGKSQVGIMAVAIIGGNVSCRLRGKPRIRINQCFKVRLLSLGSAIDDCSSFTFVVNKCTLGIWYGI